VNPDPSISVKENLYAIVSGADTAMGIKLTPGKSFTQAAAQVWKRPYL
jgi:hypothetical protein